MKIEKNKYINFIVINFFIVNLYNLMFFKIFNGNNQNDYPIDFLILFVAISIPLIIFQYPALNIRRNWLYKIIIFYGTMNLFLFLSGFIFSIYFSDKENFSNWFSDGLKMIIYGNIVGLFGFGIIVLTNFLFRKRLFSNPNS